MKKILKRALWSLLIITVLLMGAMGLFVYKVLYGFPVSYETKRPKISFPSGQPAILLFSKSTGFRHSESIDAGKKAFEELAKSNHWFLYSTESGGVFNPDQLVRFDVIIFNNCTGRILNDSQQTCLQNYIQNGGHWIGIHGAGDNSHHWDWYENNMIGAHFSHHPLEKHLQEATLTLNPISDSTLSAGLPSSWNHTDEWYIFYDNPRTRGFQVIYSFDGTLINPNGNFLWNRGKNFGMGKDHPVAWYHDCGKGRVYYTSIGHDATAWRNKAFVDLLVNEIRNSFKH